MESGPAAVANVQDEQGGIRVDTALLCELATGTAVTR